MRAENQRLISYLEKYVDSAASAVQRAEPSTQAKANVTIQSRKGVYGNATVSKEAHNKLKGE